MKKHKTALLFDKWMEQVINHYGDEDVKRKIEFLKTFLKENFQVDEYNNSYIKIKRLHSKSLLWLLLSLIIDYDTRKQNPNEQLSKLNGLGDSTYNKMKILKTMEMQEKYMSLEVGDIFPFSEITPEEVKFIELCCEKLGVDLESETKIKYILSTKQIVFLITGLMREHTIFLGSRERFEQ